MTNEELRRLARQIKRGAERLEAFLVYQADGAMGIEIPIEIERRMLLDRVGQLPAGSPEVMEAVDKRNQEMDAPDDPMRREDEW